MALSIIQWHSWQVGASGPFPKHFPNVENVQNSTFAACNFATCHLTDCRNCSSSKNLVYSTFLWPTYNISLPLILALILLFISSLGAFAHSCRTLTLALAGLSCMLYSDVDDYCDECNTSVMWMLLNCSVPTVVQIRRSRHHGLLSSHGNRTPGRTLQTAMIRFSPLQLVTCRPSSLNRTKLFCLSPFSRHSGLLTVLRTGWRISSFIWRRSLVETEMSR